MFVLKQKLIIKLHKKAFGLLFFCKANKFRMKIIKLWILSIHNFTYSMISFCFKMKICKETSQ